MENDTAKTVTWAGLVAECLIHGQSTAAVLNQAITMPDAPPIGEVTRCMLVAWSTNEERLDPAGNRLFGFCVSGHANECFLIRIFGRDATRRQAVLADLIANEPADWMRVMERIISQADKSRLEIRTFSGPAMANQMRKHICDTVIGFADTAVQARNDPAAFVASAPSQGAADQPSGVPPDEEGHADVEEAENQSDGYESNNSATLSRPLVLWSEDDMPRSVHEYTYAFMGEFSEDRMRSQYPYQGAPSTVFRRIADSPPPLVGRRYGTDSCWTLTRNSILNGVTADLLAGAEWLGGTLEADDSSMSPGGIGAGTTNLWVSLLDGGVGVEVSVWEHETTNRVKVSQITSICGPKAYRAILELLGFDWVKRKLPGEDMIPIHDDYIELVCARGDEDDENALVISPLQRRVSVAGYSVRIAIYKVRWEDEEWVLEVVDDLNNSTAYRERFLTDQLALECFLSDLEAEGIKVFIGTARAISSEAGIALMRLE